MKTVIIAMDKSYKKRRTRALGLLVSQFDKRLLSGLIW